MRTPINIYVQNILSGKDGQISFPPSSRSNLISEEELDEKLSQLLPTNMIELVKSQSKLLPPDPYMEELKSLHAKIDALTEKVAAGTTSKN